MTVEVADPVGIPDQPVLVLYVGEGGAVLGDVQRHRRVLPGDAFEDVGEPLARGSPTPSR